MGVFRIFPEKDTWITDERPDNSFSTSIRASGSNHGRSPALNVFARKGEIVSGSAELARSLLQFSVTELSGLIFVDKLIPSASVSYHLKMFDQRHEDTVPSSYNLEVFPVSIPWDEGNGIDDDNHADLGFASWKDATTTQPWCVTGSDYLSDTNFRNVLVHDAGSPSHLADPKADASGNFYVTSDLDDVWTTYKSSDRGCSWTAIDTPFDPGRGKALDVGPGGELYAAGQSVAGVSGTIRRSHVSSSTIWDTVDLFHTGTSSPYSAIAIDPSNGDRVYAIGRGSGILFIRRTTDGGSTWATVQSTASISSPDALAVAPNGDVYYGSNTYVSGGRSFAVGKSVDNGDTWNIVDSHQEPGGETGNSFVRSLYIEDSNTIYAGGFAATGSLFKDVVRKSVDAGATWNTIFTGSTTAPQSFHAQVMGITKVKDTLYLSRTRSSSLDGNYAQVLKSDDESIYTTVFELTSSRGNDLTSFNGDLLWVDLPNPLSNLNFAGFYGSGSQHFDRGDEDLEIDVTRIVADWLSGSIGQGGNPNNGVVVKHVDLEETGSANFYRKSFHSRESLFVDKLPYIEARWENIVKDNRPNFGFDLTGSLNFYNFVRGELTTLTGPVTASIKDSVTGDETFSTSVTAVEVSPGVFTASFAIPSGSHSGTFYDIWEDGSTLLTSGTFLPTLITGSLFDLNDTYVVAPRGLKRVYRESEKARITVNVRKKNFVTHFGVVATASLTPQTEFIEKMYYSVLNDETGEVVIPFGTGSVPYTQLSYNASGNYFDLWMRTFVPGFKYRLLFLLDINNDEQVIDDDFTFKVK